MPRTDETTIAVRVLSNANGERESVRICIDRPVEGDDGDWICAYHIDGDGLDQGGEASGIDALQALTQAMEGVRIALKDNDRVLTWPGGEPGDIGIPRQVPTYIDRDTSERIEKLIDKEIAGWAQRGASRKSGPKATR